jgi:hypothetical protein
VCCASHRRWRNTRTPMTTEQTNYEVMSCGRF